MSIKKVSIIGLILWFMYFIIVIGFLITSSLKWLIIFEIITILGGIWVIPWMIIIPFSDDKKEYKTLAVVAASACMILTTVTHTISLTVTSPLIASGVTVPEYWQIGQ